MNKSAKRKAMRTALKKNAAWNFNNEFASDGQWSLDRTDAGEDEFSTVNILDNFDGTYGVSIGNLDGDFMLLDSIFGNGASFSSVDEAKAAAQKVIDYADQNGIWDVYDLADRVI